MQAQNLFQLTLDHNSERPLQQQLHAHIRAMILSGSLPAGTRLPSSRALSGDLATARITVTETYDQLIAEGYLTSKIGAGTYVAEYVPDDLGSMYRGSTKVPAAVADTTPTFLMSGSPALDEFPRDKWARAAGRVSRKLTKADMLQNDPMGYLPLRAEIATYLKQARNVQCAPEQVMIVSGLQQGLFVLSSISLSPEEKVILEDPGYGGLVSAAKASGRALDFTGVDDLGALPPKGRGLLVISPSRHYPLGLTMPHGRRLELLAWARKTRSFILEDDYDSEFRYAGRPLNSLQGIDEGNRVIYGGTFSKSLFPSLRMGYLVLPPQLIAPATAFREATDSYPSISNQLILNDFFESGEFSRHVRRLRKSHAERKGIFEIQAQTYLRQWLDLQPSDAGLHILAWLSDAALASNLNDEMLTDMAQTFGIGAAPVSRCYRSTPPRQGLLLGFANLKPQEIEPAIQGLAAKIRQETGFSS